MISGAIASPDSAENASMDRVLMLGLGMLAITSEAIYLRLARFDAINGLWPVTSFVAYMVALFVLYGLAFMLLRRIKSRMTTALAIVIFGAVVFRFTLIPAGLSPHPGRTALAGQVRIDLQGKAVSFDRYLLYDDDIWRYLWDGHVWGNSVNPFQFAPDDPRLDYLATSTSHDVSTSSPVWQDIRDNINHAHIRTIYPPLAQVIFRLSAAIAPGSVVLLKSLLIGVDLLTVLLVHVILRMQGAHHGWLLLYAWNPLLIKVIAGSGHIDIVAAALLTLTAYLLLRRAYLLSALALSGAVLVKLAPAILIPFLARRIGWRRSLVIPVAIVAAYLPFLTSGGALFAGFTKFAREWEFNSAFFDIMRFLVHRVALDPGLAARRMGVLAILITIIWFWLRDDGRPASFPFVASVLGMLILFSPTVMPWYLVWLLPFAVLSRSTVWIWFSGAVCLAFFVMVNGTISTPLLVTEYGVFLCVALRKLIFRGCQTTLARLRTAHPFTLTLTKEKTL